MSPITVAFAGGKKVDARIGDYVVKTDQPQKNGGEGSAPTPFQLFLASLATCAGYFALEFCASRQIPTAGVSVTMNVDFNAEKHMCDRLRFEVKVPADFPEKYRQPLQRAVDACLVKKHLATPPAMETVILS